MAGTNQLSSAPAGGGTQAVDRAAALLTMVVEAEEPVTFAELSEACGLARSTTSRLLAALERTHLVERSGTGSYVGGQLFVLYAARHDRHRQLARLAQPVLERLGELTGETAHLAVPNRGRVEHVAQVDSTYLLSARDWNDVDVPPHCSALGKVLLAWEALELPAGRLEAPSPHTLATRPALLDHLEVVRAAGYAVTEDELEVGLCGVAAPVTGIDVSGRVAAVAALGLSGPTARLHERVGQLGRLLIEEADGLSSLLQLRTHREGVA